MTDMTRRDRERGFFFDCPALGIKAHSPTHSMYNMYRYNVAFSRASEIPEEERGIYLDYGCGSGWGCELVGSCFERSVGYDLPGEHLIYAEEIHHRSRTLFTSSPAIVASHAPYDFITCFEVIEHVDAEAGADMVRAVHAMAKPEAFVMFSTPCASTKDGSNPSNPYHIHEYHPGELKALLLRFWPEVLISQSMGNMMIASCFGGKK